MLSSSNMNPNKTLLTNWILYLDLIASLLHDYGLLSVQLQLVYDQSLVQHCVTMFMICKYNYVVMCWCELRVTSYEVLV